MKAFFAVILLTLTSVLATPVVPRTECGKSSIFEERICFLNVHDTQTQ